MGNNSAGLNGKIESFKNLLEMLHPGVCMVQETKIYKKGTHKFENYCVFEKIRDTNEGGGLMTIVHNNLQPALIPNRNISKQSKNVLVVEATVNKSKI